MIPTPVKPFLKWVGGKTQLLDDVLAHVPMDLQTYHEPFVGGGSVLLAVLSTRKITGTVYASDLNQNLINLYKTVQSNPEALLAEVKILTTEFDAIQGTQVNRKPKTRDEALTSPESYYYWIRSRFNALKGEERSTPAAAALMLFLNKTCFRGVYREGPKGYNVPFGHYKNPSILEEAHIRSVSKLLQGVVFAVASFTESLPKVEEGDFVYLDPPYAPETGTSFVSYTADGFALEDHKALFTLCRDLTAKKVKFLMSNAKVSLVTDAFPSPPYTTQSLSARRAIHSKKPETRAMEVLITN